MKVRSVGPFTDCRGRLASAVSSPAEGPACTIFAIALQSRRLLHWHRNGEDVRRRLPVLSTYLGHGHVTDTYWYVSGTPELMEVVGERLEKRWEAHR